MKFNEDGTILESFESKDLDPRGYLYVPEQVTCIGSAFKGCVSLVALSQALHAPYPPLNKNEELLPKLTRIIFHSAVTHIQKGAFENCSNLVSISLAKGMTIEDEAFKGCTSLEQVLISPGVFLGKGAFSQCRNLKKIIVSTNAVVGPYTFSNCQQLAITYKHLIAASIPNLLKIKSAALESYQDEKDIFAALEKAVNNTPMPEGSLTLEECEAYRESMEQAINRTRQLIRALEEYVIAQKSATFSSGAGFFSLWLKNNQREILKMEELINRIKKGEPVAAFVFSIHFIFREKIIDILIEYQLLPDTMKVINGNLNKDKNEDLIFLLLLGLGAGLSIHSASQNKTYAMIGSLGTSLLWSLFATPLVEQQYQSAAQSISPN